MGSKNKYFRQQNLPGFVYNQRKENDITSWLYKEITENSKRRSGFRKKMKKPGFRRKEMNKEHVGSSFDDFLKEENIAVEVKNEAIKRLISYNLLDEMKKQNINKTEMAKRMSTSRAALDRLLNPYNDSVTLATLTKAADVLGKKLVLQLQ